MGKLTWKMNKFSSNSFKKVLIMKVSKFSNLKGRNKIIFSKYDLIINSFYNIHFLIYKGCFYRKLLINKFIIGYRFGEFSYTRKPFRYMLKSKK